MSISFCSNGAAADGSIGSEVGPSGLATAAPDAGAHPPSCADPFAGGRLLETLGFEGEGPMPLDQLVGAGLDGRFYTDLSRLTTDSLVIPNERFFIRTRYPDRLKPTVPGVQRRPGESHDPAALMTSAPSRPYLPARVPGNGGGAYTGLSAPAPGRWFP
jgi:hypothetical protein